MKKLIIAACAMVFAVVANAAAIDWYMTDGAINDSKGTLIGDELTAYLIDANFSDMSFVSAWASGGIAGALAAAGDYVVDDQGYTYEGMVVADQQATYTDRAISAYYAIVNGDELFISHTQAAVLDPVASNVSTIEFTFDENPTVTLATDYAGGAAWVQNVPEPTSGLLLLLGVAGLALRRRRA